MTASLDHLRRQAKALKRAFTDGDAAALRRVHAITPDAATLQHSGALHVIASEQGYPSWPRLKAAMEVAAMDRTARAGRLRQALAKGHASVIEALLAAEPGLRAHDFGVQCAMYDDRAIERRLRADPQAALRPVAERAPILHLAFSQYVHLDPDAEARMLRVAELLLAAGADVNDSQTVAPGADHRLSALYGAIGHAGNLALGRWLLEHGADPNDNESLYHATELDTLDGVKLLFDHGAQVGTTNAFLRMLDKESPEGVRLFLANGADPNAPPYRHPSDQPAEARNALHHAILRGRSADIGELLLNAGVDASATLDGHSAYALARLCGNSAMAAMLAKRGLAHALDAGETFLAAIAELDERTARQALATTPDLIDRLHANDLARITQFAAWSDRLAMLRLMADLGFDFDRPGEEGMPPVHMAAWWGHAEIVEMYVQRGARLDGINDYGADALGTAIHGSANCPGRAEGDYERVIEALVAGGARIDADAGHFEMGTDAVRLLLESLQGAG
ncbi:MAG: ankyrin repeat domain-containing protein [Geminicoccaceae bacterium]